MKIGGFVRERDGGIAQFENLHAAAVRMRTSGLSCLPVLRRGDVVALITAGDLVKAMAISDRPREARVADYMRTGPITVGPDEDGSVALMRMLAIGCLDLPVVRDRGLVGMVSARELLAAQVLVHGVAV
jgi:CBS domain-containing protein